MEQEYCNYIIKPDDPRYNKLNEIYKKYSFDNLYWKGPGTTVKWYLPPELVLENHLGNKLVITDEVTENYIEYDENWIGKSAINWALYKCSHLTAQEYFDICILHINKYSDRPKCEAPGCDKYVPWGGRLTWGYNQTHWWNEVSHVWCCDSCAKKFHAFHPELYPDYAQQISDWMNEGWAPYALTKSGMTRYIGYGNPDDAVILYVTTTWSGHFKFGLTINLQMRIYQEPMNGDWYINPHKILVTTRIEAAYIEATIKLKFNGREYLNLDEISDFFKVCKQVLSIRPVKNPFENE